ncbi:hypothetical protein GSI_12392 [Ganoderma sinense ZZ0214-1]|uniref:Uncharacterized protein n=1 Tax=Ganoderma sinense ZZ0214-1 TaxID=1077348 RepID=A0A2G8RVP5_9APHY|nr:hypothetical protein GSI_12392 [Ganoderma sinense ZZ0214-1]
MLQEERDAIIREYWSSPQMLLCYLTWNRAVISGEAALAFMARCPRILTDELEICVPKERSYEFLALLDENPAVERVWSEEDWSSRKVNQPTSYLYRTPTERFIRVICSHTESAFTPITTYPTCALVNYMDQFSFGCAYPHTTLKYHAVTPDLPNLSSFARARVDRIVELGGFRLDRWPNPSTPPADDSLPLWASTVCLREIFQCPGQARFFGDQGSLLDFYQPDMVDHGVMAHFHHPPYGLTAVWRMESEDCTRACASGDYLLRGTLSEVSVLGRPLHYGPFTTAVIGRVKTGESQHK